MADYIPQGTPEELLEQLRAITAELEEAKKLTARRDRLVFLLATTKLPRQRIAAAANLTPDMVYKIRTREMAAMWKARGGKGDGGDPGI